MEPAGKMMVLALAMGGAYLGYKQILQPYWAQQELEAKAKALAAKSGSSLKDSVAQVASLACQAYVTGQTGSPPNALTKAGCGLAGTLTAVVGAPALKFAAREVAHDPLRATAVILAAPVAAPLLATNWVAKKIPGVATAEHSVTNVAKKLKFWGLEGVSC